MTTSDERRNELDRARHTKATRVTLYELGIMVAALNVADKGAGIWTKYEGFPLWGAVGIFVISLGFMGYMRWSDGSALADLEHLLKDAGQADEN